MEAGACLEHLITLTRILPWDNTYTAIKRFQLDTDFTGP